MEQDHGAPGELILVATPIGNLGDLSPRALETLASADVVYCEDTRRSRVLFSAHGVATRGRLRALHEHNEASESEAVVLAVRSGRIVALVSDAGTPGISDPGARVVAAVAAAGLRVTTAPGPSAVIAALSVSGLPTERFAMEGFLPRKRGERDLIYEAWSRETRTVVFFESPARIAASLQELAERFGERRVAVCRELTKMHEEVVRGTLRDVAVTLAGREARGEFVVVLAGAIEPGVADEAVRAALAERLSAGASVRDAVSFVEATLGASHRVAYAMAVELQSEGES